MYVYLDVDDVLESLETVTLIDYMRDLGYIIVPEKDEEYTTKCDDLPQNECRIYIGQDVIDEVIGDASDCDLIDECQLRGLSINKPNEIEECIDFLWEHDYYALTEEEFVKYKSLVNSELDKESIRRNLCDLAGIQYVASNDELISALRDIIS